MQSYKFKYETFDRAHDIRVNDVTVCVTATDEEEALNKVMSLIAREYFVLVEITQELG